MANKTLIVTPARRAVLLRALTANLLRLRDEKDRAKRKFGADDKDLYVVALTTESDEISDILKQLR